MKLTLKEKLYLYKDVIRMYEQLQTITLTLNLISANLNNKQVDICINKMENVCIKQLKIIKEILIDKLNLKDKLNKNVLNKITLNDILEL